VAAITSATQGSRFESLAVHRVPLCVFMVALITVINLRGVREAGAIFAGPTYLFIFSMLALVVYGFFRYYLTHEAMPTPQTIYHDDSIASVTHSALTGGAVILLLMRAFAAGCTALTGVEAISNGISAFKQPETHNAATTLAWMSLVMATLILGTGVLAYKLNAHPVETETLVSAMARHTFGTNIFYYIIQASTAAILILAANTSFAGFPRLAGLLAADRFLPRQFANRGDRLVYSNGIVILAVLAIILIVMFKGQEQAMLPLYAVGVFLSFTLSQSGMVVHWLRERRAEDAVARIKREERAKRDQQDRPAVVDRDEQLLLQEVALKKPGEASHALSILINGAGALISGIVLVVIAVTKFTRGAWAVIVLIPLLVLLFRSIHGHYMEVARQLSTEGLEKLRPIRHEVLVPISGIHRGVLGALEYAKSIAPDHVTAIYVDFDEEATRKLREKWEQWGNGVKLVVLASPYRSLTRPLLRYIDRVERRAHDDIVTVVLPEFVPARWWQNLLHNQSSLMLKGALLFKKGIVVTNVPYHLDH
jgi:amino acid transporter